MILRRITSAFRRQDWFAVGIETLIVVLGVFLGLQANNWNEARLERAELNQQLIGLRRELEDNRTHFKDFRAELVHQMDDVESLRSAFKADPPSISNDEFNARFLNVLRIKTFSPELTALNELAETGGLRRLSSPTLRKAISDWQAELDNVNRRYADGLRERDSVMNPFMMQNIAYGPLLEQSFIVGDDISESKFRNDVKALAESREVDNQLAIRYGITGSTVYALDALDRETTLLIDLLAKREGEP